MDAGTWFNQLCDAFNGSVVPPHSVGFLAVNIQSGFVWAYPATRWDLKGIINLPANRRVKWYVAGDSRRSDVTGQVFELEDIADQPIGSWAQGRGVPIHIHLANGKKWQYVRPPTLQTVIGDIFRLAGGDASFFRPPLFVRIP